MNIQASIYLSSVRDEMRLFIRRQKRPTVNELEGMMLRLNTCVALTEELEAENALQGGGREARPHTTIFSDHDNNGGDAA